MDILQQSALAWKELTEYRYQFVYGYKKTLYPINLTFSSADYPHLAGFQYLKDLSLPNYTSAKIVDRILERKIMKNCFDNTVANGIMARNQIIDLSTEPLAELLSAEPFKRTELIKDISFLNSAKIQSNEADVENIKNILMKIIRKIKEDVTAQQPTGAIATAEAVKGIRAALPDKPQSELTIDNVSVAVAAYVGTMLPMDESTSELLQDFVSQKSYICVNTVVTKSAYPYCRRKVSVSFILPVSQVSPPTPFQRQPEAKV